MNKEVNTSKQFKFYKMKKLIGITGMMIFALAISFNPSTTSDSDFTLENLISLNNANAEDPEKWGYYPYNKICSEWSDEFNMSVYGTVVYCRLYLDLWETPPPCERVSCDALDDEC